MTVTGLGGAQRPELFAGGRPVGRARSAGPKRGEPGMDEIVFELPRVVLEGCYVPLYARTAAGVISNVVTISVARKPGPCADPAGWPKPAMRSGLVLLSRFSMLLEIRPGDPEPGNHESADAVFLSTSGRGSVTICKDAHS